MPPSFGNRDDSSMTANPCGMKKNTAAIDHITNDPGPNFAVVPRCQTQDGYQIEQDQIAQFERAYELRLGLCRLRSQRSREKKFNALPRINPETIDEMKGRVFAR